MDCVIQGFLISGQATKCFRLQFEFSCVAPMQPFSNSQCYKISISSELQIWSLVLKLISNSIFASVSFVLPLSSKIGSLNNWLKSHFNVFLLCLHYLGCNKVKLLLYPVFKIMIHNREGHVSSSYAL